MTAGSVENRVLVLGVGNLLLQDDAVGLRLLEMLAAGPPSSGVDFVDGGTRGLALLECLEGRRAVLILDAIGLGANPGAVHVLRGAAIDALRARRATTAHEGNALELLAIDRLVSGETREIVVIGVEPGRVATGIGLTHQVEAALPEAVQRARDILQDLREGAGGWRPAAGRRGGG